jgi:hypothetical protein
VTRAAPTTCVGLVTGPLQAISAVDAFAALAATGTVYHYSHQPPSTALGDLYSRAGLGLRWLGRGNASERARALARMLTAAAGAGRLLLGSLHQRPFLLAALLSRRRLVLVDDGSLTETVGARRHAGLAAGTWLGRRVDARPLCFFTIYAPPLAAGDDRLVNRWQRVRSLYAGSFELANEAWIVAQPFVDYGWMTATEYTALIEPFVARARAAGAEPLYLPHPRESAAAAGAVCAPLGLREHRLDAPVELDLLARRRSPRMLFSVSSTVLDTLPLLRPDLPDGLELWSSRAGAEAVDGAPPGLVARLQAVAARRDLERA